MVEYINHPAYETIGFAASVNGAPAESFTGNYEYTKRKLDELDLENNILIAHNAQFDAAILAYRYNILPARMFCTAMGSRPYIVPHTDSMSLKNTTGYLGIGVKGTEVLNALGKRRADFTVDEMDKYMEYCRNDVDIMVPLYNYLIEDCAMPEEEQERRQEVSRQY